MKLKKLGLIIVLVVGTLLAACGGKNNSEGNEKVTIEFMHSSVEQERLAVITELVEKFEDANPDVEVKQVAVEEDSYNTRIITFASSNKLPAVIEVGQDYAKVMDKDELLDHESVKRIIDEVGADKYYDGALRLMKTEDGENFTGVPISGWVQGIWYNKEMLKDKGFEEPESWSEILEIAEAFMDKDNKKYGIALPTVEGGFSEQSFSQFALSNNANILDSQGELIINSPEMNEALAFYKKLAEYTMPGSNDTTEVKDAFMNGTVPMAVYSTYILPSMFTEGEAANVGFAVPTEKTKAVYGTVSALTITSGLEDDQKIAAEKFVAFMSQAENTTDWILMSPGGAQPVNKEVVENEKYKSNEIVKAFGDLFTEIAASFEDIQVFGLVDGKNYLKMGEISSTGAISRMVNSVTVGNKDVKSEIENAEKSISEQLK